jgi:hypothetical protein
MYLRAMVPSAIVTRIKQAVYNVERQDAGNCSGAQSAPFDGLDVPQIRETNELCPLLVQQVLAIRD